MLLVVDIGNTNITLGVFENEDITATFRITTKIQRTSDEFGMLITNLLNSRKIELSKIKEEADDDRIKVVATGGLGKIIADSTDKIDIYDSNLTLKGLRLIYNRVKGIS